MPRKVMRGWEKVALGVIAIIFLSFALQKCGVKVAKTSEDSELIHKPHRD